MNTYDIFVAFVYLLGIVFGLWVGWYIWRKPNLVYRTETKPLLDIMVGATMKVLFTQEELNSDTFIKLKIIVEQAKMTKDPYDFLSRHINATGYTEYSDKK